MKRVEQERGASAGSVGNVGDTISAWLLGFERVMVGTAEEKRETRAELESHLRDRARDLMLAGLNADEAARRAIDELGEAAEIAASYRATRVESQRRKVMQVAAIGLAAGAAVVSVAAMFQGARATPTMASPVMAEPAMVASSAVASVEQADPTLTRTTIEVEKSSELMAGDAVSLRLVKLDGETVALRASKVEMAIAASVPLTLEDYRAPLEESELLAKTTVTGKVEGARVIDALRAIADGSGGKIRVSLERVESMTECGVENLIGNRAWKGVALVQVMQELSEGLPECGRIVARDRGEYLEVGPARLFDARETRFVAYRVEGVLGRAFSYEADETKRAELLRGTLSAMVYRDDWADNGGSIGEMHYAGGSLFVKAPERHQHMVAWVLRKLSAE